MEDDIKDLQSIRANPSQDEKFAFFLCELLRRGQGTIFEQGREENFRKQFKPSKIPDLDVRRIELRGKGTSEKMIRILKEKCELKKLNFLLDLVAKYRWGSGIAAFVIIGTQYVITHEYGGFEKYLKIANTKHEEDFQKDKLLSKKDDGITYVGPKVRDLALCSFLNNYLAVDRLVKTALLRTGMLIHMYKYGIKVESMDDYWGIHALCIRLAKNARMKPCMFDKALWNFVKKFCNPTYNKGCGNCSVYLCLSHP